MPKPAAAIGEEPSRCHRSLPPNYRLAPTPGGESPPVSCFDRSSWVVRAFRLSWHSPWIYANSFKSKRRIGCGSGITPRLPRTRYIRLLARQIQENQYGVIRGLFLPEWLCQYRDQNAGIDWEIWQPGAQSNFESNFYEAMLVWCDETLKAILELKKEWPFLIDNVLLDFYSAIVLIDNDVRQTIKEISRMNNTTSFSAAETCKLHIS
jgi:hypothetical protein